MFKITFSAPNRTPAAVRVDLEKAGTTTEHYTVTADNVADLVTAYMCQGYTATVTPVFTNNFAGASTDGTRGTTYTNV